MYKMVYDLISKFLVEYKERLKESPNKFKFYIILFSFIVYVLEEGDNISFLHQLFIFTNINMYI